MFRRLSRPNAQDNKIENGPGFLFVYGTLMRELANNPFLDTPFKAAYFANGSVRGELFDVGEFPGFVPSENGAEVRGEVFQVKIAESLFETLDIVEGVNDQYPERSLFERTTTNVKLENGENLEAWIYQYNLSPANLKRIENGDYREYLVPKSMF